MYAAAAGRDANIKFLLGSDAAAAPTGGVVTPQIGTTSLKKNLAVLLRGVHPDMKMNGEAQETFAKFVINLVDRVGRAYVADNTGKANFRKHLMALFKDSTKDADSAAAGDGDGDAEEKEEDEDEGEAEDEAAGGTGNSQPATTGTTGTTGTSATLYSMVERAGLAVANRIDFDVTDEAMAADAATVTEDVAHELFAAIDRNGDNSLDQQEIGDVFASFSSISTRFPPFFSSNSVRSRYRYRLLREASLRSDIIVPSVAARERKSES
jgi:hypothetical protein